MTRRVERQAVGRDAHMLVGQGFRVLPVFRGWTVDVRLREFRRVRFARDGAPLAFVVVSFASPEGDALLVAYVAWCSPEELDDLCRYVP